MAGAFEVQTFTLGNGLRVLLVPDTTSPTFAYQTWFRVGSRDEQPGRTGLAHLFEHMMFKQTKSLKDGEFDRILESAGAEGENAFTSHDYTAYVQELPKASLDLIAKLEADRMVNLIVDEKAFKTETEVVQNERRFRNENNPSGLMFQELFELAYRKHPYRWPVIGYQKDLEAMSAADALEFYRSFYSPNHATIIVSGDLNSETLRAVLEKHYGSIPPQPVALRQIEREPPQLTPRRKLMNLNIQVEMLLMGFHIPEVTHEDFAPLEVLSTILAGGKSSRLNRTLVDTGIAASVNTWAMENKDPSLFLVSVTMQDKMRAAQAETVVLGEIERIAHEGVRDQELETAKNKIQFSFLASLGSNSGRTRFLGHYEAIAGDFRAGLKLRDRTLAVTPAQVQAAAKRYLNARTRSVVVGLKRRQS
ncbi:MAG: hypothetical protein A2X94_06205 [Bdellovibrionales bacterium GWB1_55_8]|nr:MAG: hypothetical protein A2X94_06205 [Bdellovibrionales bacterium GWB1_55_8]